MKNYEDMARDVLHRINEYEAEKEMKRAKMTKVAASVTPVCAAAVVGVGLWKCGVLTQHNDQLISSTIEATSSDVPSADNDAANDKYSENNKNTTGSNGEPEKNVSSANRHSATLDATIPTANENATEDSNTNNASSEVNIPDNIVNTKDYPQESTGTPAVQTEVYTQPETTKASVYSQVAMGDMLAIKSVNGIVYMQFFSNDVYTRGEYIGESSAFIGFPEQGSIYLSNESPDVIILWFTADSQVTLKKTDISPEQYKIEYEQMKEIMNNGTCF